MFFKPSTFLKISPLDPVFSSEAAPIFFISFLATFFFFFLATFLERPVYTFSLPIQKSELAGLASALINSNETAFTETSNNL